MPLIASDRQIQRQAHRDVDTHKLPAPAMYCIQMITEPSKDVQCVAMSLPTPLASTSSALSDSAS